MCGKAFKCRRCEPTETCSKKCGSALKSSRSDHTLFACDYCGKKTKRLTKDFNDAEHNHFCSRECWREWLRANPPACGAARRNRITSACKECGATIEFTPSQLNFKGYGTFCSRACTGRWYAREKYGERALRHRKRQSYGPGWKPQRRKARERDNYTCQRCGIGEDELGRQLAVHHIKPLRKFTGENRRAAHDLDNLICLCQHCHLVVEPHKMIGFGK